MKNIVQLDEQFILRKYDLKVSMFVYLGFILVQTDIAAIWRDRKRLTNREHFERAGFYRTR